MRTNPFFALYVGERFSSSEFVTIFSPFLVTHTEALFLPGNVVVKGVQGSGKSMLLSLLKSEVRMAYASASATFPVRHEISNFVGAGVNLAHSNAIDFGYRSISNDATETALFFADFVNYTILLDLFDSLTKLSELPATDVNLPVVNLSRERTSGFIGTLAAAEVFQGTLADCISLADVKDRIFARLNAYRRFLHLNDDQLNPQIRESKTDIGEPITVAVRLLKESQIIKPEVPIFIHIDQYEELANIPAQETDGPDYRRIINRGLARREQSISYRIGTRGHAWRNHGYILGSDAKLEEERDYKFVDLDEMLRRHENRKSWVFPQFAADVFARRLKHVGLASADARGAELLEQIFGKGLSAPEKAKRIWRYQQKTKYQIRTRMAGRFSECHS